MDWEIAWSFFIFFAQFFVIVLGPVIVAALPVLIAEGILLGFYFVFMDIFGLGD